MFIYYTIIYKSKIYYFDTSLNFANGTPVRRYGGTANFSKTFSKFFQYIGNIPLMTLWKNATGQWQGEFDTLGKKH